MGIFRDGATGFIIVRLKTQSRKNNIGVCLFTLCEQNVPCESCSNKKRAVNTGENNKQILLQKVDGRQRQQNEKKLVIKQNIASGMLSG